MPQSSLTNTPNVSVLFIAPVCPLRHVAVALRDSAAGDPLVLAGMSGWELSVWVLEEAGVSFPHERPDTLHCPPDALLERVPSV